MTDEELFAVANTPDIGLTKAEIEPFLESKAWLAIRQIAVTGLISARSKCYSAGSTMEQIRHAQGAMDVLQWLISSKENMINSIKSGKTLDGVDVDTVERDVRQLMGY